MVGDNLTIPWNKLNMSQTLITVTSYMLTDPNEIKHILRWRQYQQWIKSLPLSLQLPIKGVRNPECTALGKIMRNSDPKL